MIDRRSLLAAAIACASAPVLSRAALAQSGRVTKLVVPLTAGSPIDVLARLYTQPLTVALGDTVIIENKPGAGTTIAAKLVASAEPDGQTLLVASTSHPISAAVYRNLTYDPFKDFTAVAPLATTPWVVIVAPSIPAATLRELIVHAKANPGKVNFGFGQGTAPHIIGEAIKKTAGVDIAGIPYKGGAQVIPDMMSGIIHMNIGTPSTLLPLIQRGAVKAVAVTSPKRIPELPNVPTLAESGFASLPEFNWAGLIAPRGTPAAIAARINAAVTGAARLPEVQAALAKLGFQAWSGSPAEFAAFLDGERLKWGSAVKLAGVQV